MLADKGYDGESVLNFADSLGAKPVIPPKSNRKNSQEYLELAKEDARMTKQLFEALQEQLSKLSVTEGGPLEEKDVPTDISNHNITNQQ